MALAAKFFLAKIRNFNHFSIRKITVESHNDSCGQGEFGCGRKVSMSAIGKAALFLAATSSVLAAAQATQPSPAQKPSPAVNAASPAPTGQQRAPVSPYGHRFVPSENAPHPNQPVPSAQPAPRQATPQVVKTPAMPVVQPRPVPPPTIQPAIPTPVAAQPPIQPAIQPPVAQPVAMSLSSASGSAAVDYSRGELTVVSERATLGQVLKLVAAKTGGMIDVATELQNEPVVARLGPGPVREVLTGLLDSPKIDYIIMGAGDGPGGLERIVVRTRQSFGRTAMAAVHPAQPQPQPEEATKVNDAVGHVPNGVAPADAKLTQEQLMENWKKTREQMRLAEMQQQAQERETEQNHAQVEPQAEPQPEQPTEPPPPPDNPPQR
jgi:hypothetical protein